jgi:hypothetical protein
MFPRTGSDIVSRTREDEMAEARLNIKKAGNDSYKLVFQSEKGKIVCEVPLEAPGRGSTSEEDRREMALQRARMLTGAFHEAIPQR